MFSEHEADLGEVLFNIAVCLKDQVVAAVLLCEGCDPDGICGV